MMSEARMGEASCASPLATLRVSLVTTAAGTPATTLRLRPALGGLSPLAIFGRPPSHEAAVGGSARRLAAILSAVGARSGASRCNPPLPPASASCLRSHATACASATAVASRPTSAGTPPPPSPPPPSSPVVSLARLNGLPASEVDPTPTPHPPPALSCVLFVLALAPLVTLAAAVITPAGCVPRARPRPTGHACSLRVLRLARLGHRGGLSPPLRIAGAACGHGRQRVVGAARDRVETGASPPPSCHGTPRAGRRRAPSHARAHGAKRHAAYHVPQKTADFG